MTRCPRHLPPLFAASLLASPSLLLAQQAPQLPPPPQERVQDDRPPPRRSLSDAVRKVERNTRGEVLSAERIQYDGRDMHRVKVVDDRGRVRVFMQDPARGNRPKQSQDDDED